MLVLSRRMKESICIGDGIEVRVLEVSGGRVRLGITAPAEVPVHRSEVAARLSEFHADSHSPTGQKQPLPDQQPVIANVNVDAGVVPGAGDVRLRRRAR